MKKLEGFQRKFLRGVAHTMKPVIFIGQKGLTPQVITSAKDAIESHELIKVKFNEFKEKEQKEEISARIEEETGAENVGMIGHTAIFSDRTKTRKNAKSPCPGGKKRPDSLCLERVSTRPGFSPALSPGNRTVHPSPL